MIIRFPYKEEGRNPWSWCGDAGRRDYVDHHCKARWELRRTVENRIVRFIVKFLRLSMKSRVVIKRRREQSVWSKIIMYQWKVLCPGFIAVYTYGSDQNREWGCRPNSHSFHSVRPSKTGIFSLPYIFSRWHWWIFRGRNDREGTLNGFRRVPFNEPIMTVTIIFRLSLSLTHIESLYPWNWNMHLWTGFLINFLVTARGRADSSEIHLFVRRHLYLDCVFILSSPRLRDEATAKLVRKK